MPPWRADSVPVVLHGVSTVDRIHHDIPMVGVTNHYVVMVSPWPHHEDSIVGSKYHIVWPRHVDGISMAGPTHHGVSMAPTSCLLGAYHVPWCGHGVPVACLWCLHDGSHVHSVDMAAPWWVPITLVSPRHPHRASVVSAMRHGVAIVCS